ncbi:MAG TPA: dihydrolipoamide acetyltransferase family protein, partial [Actinomycetota bacterium]|nr:dihydrolipoamide acetyltransferase family protein [Actinomycetota bacterium]
MATEIKMPQLGESVVEGTITRWLKQEGDTIQEDELLVEVSTDKVDSEVPSSASGTIERILVQEGDTVKVGTAIALVGEGGESSGNGRGAAGEQREEASEAPEQQAGEEQPEPAADSGESDRQAARAESVSAGDEAEEALAAKEGTASDKAAAAGDTSKRGIISPLVRRLADEHSVELDQIEGTGTGGRIRKQDVLKFVERQKARPAAAATEQAEAAPAPKERKPEPAAVSREAGERETLVPWNNIRRRTAEHMVASSREVARAWNAVEVDWSNVAKLRAQARESFRAKEGFGLTYMPFLAKSLCETLLEMPVINSTYDPDQQGNVEKHYVNLGIAVALEGGGLIVPVIKNADEKNLIGLARGVYDVATRARSKKLTPDDLTDGTFSITNPGPFGSIMSVPIIPRSQTAILAFEAITKQVVATEDDQIAIRHMGILDMSWDHRAIDGAEAAQFLARLKERIETTDFSAELQQ